VSPGPKARLFRVLVLLATPLALLGLAVGWSWFSGRPPTHEMCVAQAEHRLDLMFGEKLAHEANEHPADHERLRNSMITTCERYWTRRYAACLMRAASPAAVEECEKVGRVR
jgi:hypothetical protein